MTNTETCNDLTSVDCNRNHPVILVCPFFTLCPDSFPSLVASYHPVDVHCLSIIYSYFFLIDGTRRSNFICNCSRYSHVTSLLLQELHVWASLLNQALYARVWAFFCMIYLATVPRKIAVRWVLADIQSWSWWCGHLISFTNPLTGLLLTVRREVHKSAVSKWIRTHYLTNIKDGFHSQ